MDRVRHLHTLQLNQRDRAAAAGKKWFHDPVQFVTDSVTFKPNHDGTPGGLATYQSNVLTKLAETHKVATRAPHGAGKTMPASLAFWWFACTRELAGVDWKIPTTAGSWPQISVYLWPEIKKWRNQIDWDLVGLPKPRIGLEMLTHQLKWEHGEAFGRAATDPELIEGAHATNMFVIIDEGKSVADGIWDSVEGFFSTPGEHYALAQSTPGTASGRFYEIHSRKPGYEDWHPIHITLKEAIKAGRITQKWADDRLKQWGKDSVTYKCHVLGEFGGEEDGVIPLAWIEQAVERGKESEAEERPYRIGVDVSDTGDDQTVFAYINKDGCYRIDRVNAESIQKGNNLPRAIQPTVIDVADELKRLSVTGSKIVIDSIGIGAGTLAQAKRLKLDATGFVASEKTKRKDREGTFGFVNKRAAAWWNLREMLDPDLGDGLILPDDSELLGDLSAPTWREAAGGKILIESKDDIRKRLGRSTDVGDAVVMGLWEDGRERPKWGGSLDSGLRKARGI